MKMASASSLLYSDAKRAEAIVADVDAVIERAKERFEGKDVESIIVEISFLQILEIAFLNLPLKKCFHYLMFYLT